MSARGGGGQPPPERPPRPACAARARRYVPVLAEAIRNDLATKPDIAAVRSDVEALRLSTKADLREAELRLEARIAATKAEIIEGVIGAIGFQRPPAAHGCLWIGSTQ